MGEYVPEGVFMDDLRIASLDFVDSHSGQIKEGSRKRSRQVRVEGQEELIDHVTLSSTRETEEEPSGYHPPSFEPK